MKSQKNFSAAHKTEDRSATFDKVNDIAVFDNLNVRNILQKLMVLDILGILSMLIMIWLIFLNNVEKLNFLRCNIVNNRW